MAPRLVARSHRDALRDIGTTTTDIIPIVGGVVVAYGYDPARLASGELLYTGAVRTPVEALAAHVTLGGTTSALAAEGFATSGDVHVWRGDLPEGALVETADGRPSSREFAGHRLARALYADRELMDEAAVQALADALAAAQVERVAAAMRRVGARHPSIRCAVVAGLGAFVAARAAQAAGFDVLPLAAARGDLASQCAPAAAVALLLEESLSCRAPAPSFDAASHSNAGVAVQTVVKIGGSLLAQKKYADAEPLLDL
jgi:probable H4MPT-linked C1 transfer pathway protein